MPVRVASLIGVISLDDRDFRGGVQRSRQEMVGLAGSMRGMVDNVRAAGQAALVGIGALAAGAGLAGKALFDMGKEAAVFQGIEEAFQGMVESTGKGSRDMLRSLQNASAGMASNEDLMLSYNKAAQLVSTTFANQLPDAMDELTKVASATGQDMGFLMDSLVVGIGRLSPMILDNLGIQVSLTEAYEEYAASVGKSVDELTKSEQQTALAAQVMKKLEQNTASLPSVLGQSDTKLAQFEARMANIRIEIGKRVMPVFDGLISTANAVSAAFELLVTGDFTKAIGDALGMAEDSPLANLLYALHDMIGPLTEGVPLWQILGHIIIRVADAAADYDDLPLLAFLAQALDLVTNVIRPIEEFIRANFQLSDVLIAVGIAVGSVVLPALLGLLAAAAPIILTFVGLVAGVAALRQAWETNFMGIRDTANNVFQAVVGFVQNVAIPGIQDFINRLGQFWETVRPGLEQLAAWFITEGLPGIVEFITGTVIPKVQEFMNSISVIWETVRPGLEQLVAWFTTEALPGIVSFVTDTVLPGIQDFVDILEGIWTVASVGLLALQEWFETSGMPAIEGAITPVQQLWDDLQTGLSMLWAEVSPQLTPIVTWFRDTFQYIGDNYIKPVIDFIGDIISKASEALDMLRQIGGGASVDAGGNVITVSNPGTKHRDSGGPGVAGMPYIIGKPQVGNEMFIPSSNGTFVPDFVKMLTAGGLGGGGSDGIQFNGPITIVTPNPEDFMRQMEDMRRRRG